MQLHRLSFYTSRWFRGHQKLLRRTGFVVLGVTFASVVFQLAYPAGRILPFVSVEKQSVGGKTVSAAREVLDKRYAKAKLTLTTQDDTFVKSFEEIGIDVQAWNTARAAAKYSLGERLIPFSSLFIMMRRDTPMQASFDDDRLNYFAVQIQKDGFKPAVNATISVHNGEVSLVPAKKSKEYPARHVSNMIRASQFKPATQIRLQPQTKDAERTDEEVKGVLNEAQKAVNTSLTLKLGSEEIKVEKATVGGWLDFTEEPQTKKLQLALRTEVVQKYLESIQGKIYKAPGTTRIQIIDGREAGRTEGTPGQGVDIAKTMALLNETLRKGQDKATVAVPIAQLAPKVVYDRQYSNGDAGLTALLNDLGKSGYGLAVMQNGRSGNANGNKKFVAASTYKLFVAYAVFKQIEAGQMTWGEGINGRTVETCFDIMIVRSDNPCAKALGDRIGWQNIENMMRGLGLGNTELSPSLYTTANDLALFLYKLQNGSLVGAADQARLLDAMKRQIYRAGIPAGTGLSVADKVGFIDSYIHDAGIVYGPRGPYVMVIMTSGSSWGGIAEIANQINAFLNR